MRASGAALPTKPAFEFLALTAARSGEARLAVWAEIDAAAGVWVVPGQRMKSGREHRIPLTARARAILDEARAFRDEAAGDLDLPRRAARAPEL